MLLFSKKGFFLFFLLTMGVCTHDAYSQSRDSIQVRPLKLYDTHIGWGSQKYLFLGLEFHRLPLLIRGDIGHDFFSTKGSTFSMTMGWIPGITTDTVKISNIYFSTIQTFQVSAYNDPPFIITMNIGWIEQQGRSIDFNFSAGAGVKILVALKKATLFFGLDFSIGYRFN